MKITIELSENEVKALKAYLKEVSHDINPTITKEDIKQEIEGAVNSHLQAGSLGDYYKMYCLNIMPQSFYRGSMAGDNPHDDF